MVLHFATAVRLPVHHQYVILPHEGNIRACSQQVLQALLAIGTVTRRNTLENTVSLQNHNP